MTYSLHDIRAHEKAVAAAGVDPSYDRILAACRGELQARVNDVVHGHDGRAGLPRTRCGIRWIPGVMVPPTFPRGIPTEDEVDCMTCLVLEARA